MPGTLLWLTQDMPQQPIAGDTIIAPIHQWRIEVFYLTIAHCVCNCLLNPQDSEFPKHSYLTHLFVPGAHSSIH